MRKLLLLLSVFSLPAWSDTIYQCRDDRGRVTLQGVPCVAGSKTDKVVRSGQDLAKEQYLAGGGDPTQAWARSATHGISCNAERASYNAARDWAEKAAARGDLQEMQRANASVSRAGRQLSELGC